MDQLYGFLSFRTFVSPGILKIAYFTGAFVVPVLVWCLLREAGRKHPKLLGMPVAKGYEALTPKGKLRLVAFFVILAFVTEVLWRMVIEYLIAYLQMRDALLFLMEK
ncbi:MAG: DUF4282 domain-containing protein [Thermovirgaceae bacterium]